MQLLIDDNHKLELIQPDHANELFNLVDQDREYLRQWLPWVNLTESPVDIGNYIDSSLQRHRNNNGFDLVIKCNNIITGVIGLHYIDIENKQTGLGYWISEQFQRQGIMTKSCKRLIDYCLDDLKLKRIEIKCATGNTKSQRIPERLGFTREKTINDAEYLNGRYTDHFLFSLNKE